MTPTEEHGAADGGRAVEQAPSSRPIVVIPGDGVGPEVTTAAQRVMDATGVPLAWRVAHLGVRAVEHTGDALPDATLSAISDAGVALKGPVATPQDGSMPSPNIGLRRALDLPFQLRRAMSFGVGPDMPKLDLLIVRETTEDLYAGVGFDAGTELASEVHHLCSIAGRPLRDDAGVSIKFLSVSACRAAWRFAVTEARRAHRATLTAAHKAAAMPHTDGIFVDAGREIVRDAGLRFEAVAVDTLAARIVSRPAAVEMIVAPNLYGDILADIAGAVAGGVGVVAGGNYGSGDVAVFEAAHGAAWRHAGRDTADPVGVILSGALALAHMGENAAAEAITEAVTDVGKQIALAGSTPGTTALADQIIDRMAHGPPASRHIE